jgi:hypothetical protein
VSGSPGEINLFVEALPGDSTDGTGTPPPSMLTDVEAVVEFDPDSTKPLNERGRRPLSAWKINFIPINTIPVDVTITGLSNPAFLTTIQSNIQSFLYNIRPYIAGADSIRDINKGRLFESDMYNIVRETIGINATFTSLIMEVGGSPVSIYEFVDGDIPYINTVLWIL